MKFALLALTTLTLHAGPILEASGSATYQSGWGVGNPIWTFSIAGASCEETSIRCFSSSDVNIDGDWFPPGDYFVGLQPVAGLQDFYVTGQDGQISASQEYETFGVAVTSCTWLQPGYANVCTESFSFSPVGEVSNFVFPLEASNSARTAVPEPSAWLLVIAGVVLLGLAKPSRSDGSRDQ